MVNPFPFKVKDGEYGGKTRRECQAKAVFHGRDTLVLSDETVEEKISQGRRGFNEGVRNHVCHMIILVMANGRKDRYGAVGNRHCKVIVVKAGQVEVGAASSHDQDSIILGFGRKDIIQCSHDGFRCLLSLHHSLEESDLEHETIFISKKMVHEIPVAGRSRRGNDCQ